MQWTEYPPGEPLRGAVRAAIEEASREPLGATDPLPDELIAVTQIEGISLNLLRTWIYSHHPEAWSAPAFVRWARGIERAAQELRARGEART
jgi:hypothetical protein